MKRSMCVLGLALVAATCIAPKCAADDPLSSVLKRGGYTVSLDLNINRKNRASVRRVFRSHRRSDAPAFQISPGQDESLVVFAQPNGDKMVRRGVFSGPYMFGGQQFWSAKIEGRDGYSGSPVYNDRGELVGVFSRYDFSRNVALISPGVKARKLLEDYAASPER